MIRGLYQHLDTHLQDLEEKFKKDEISLRNKVDMEIKSQMAQKLKEFKYTQTDSYREDFLYELGKLSLYRDRSHCHNKGVLDINYMFNTKIGGESYGLWTDINKYEGFFNNLSKLNADKLLREDEYIVGISGGIHFNWSEDHPHLQTEYKGIRLGTINLKVISNYLNYYEVLNQYDFSNANIGRPFDERFQLKCIRKNDMKMFDNQIDIINSTFYKVDISILFSPSHRNGHNNNPITYHLYTNYDVDSFNMIELNEEKDMFEKKTNSYNYQTLPKECLVSVYIDSTHGEKLACCQKCHNALKGKKHGEFAHRNNTINAKMRENVIKDKLSYDPNIFNLFTTTGDYSILRDSNHRDYVIFMIYEKWFNDFWADKIENVGESEKDISISDLIEHKDTIIDNALTENKALNERIKLLEAKVIKNTKCSEYEKGLCLEIKNLKGKITTIEKEYKKLTNDKDEIDVKYTKLKSKLGSLIL